VAEAGSLLALAGVTVRFGGVTALEGVDFAVAGGTVTSIIGPNGAGKTTLLNAVSGMVPLAAGMIALRGEDLTRQPPHVRGRAGVVRTFQNLEIFGNMSVLENVMTGRHRLVPYGFLDCLLLSPRYRREERRCREAAMERLAFVGMEDKASSPAGDLAYGLQRRLELARALAAEPDLLLLDEPAAGLNTRETRALGELVLRVVGELGVTVALVEHDMDLVMGISDRIMCLHHGKKLAEGTPAEIQRHPEVVAAYLGGEGEEA